MRKNLKKVYKSRVRTVPVPCKICGVLFSGRIFRRYNCDLHFRQKLPEVEAERARKIAIAKKGTKRPPFSNEWKAHLRAKAQHGAKSHNWKGGITPINEKIRKSAQYVEWRRFVFERDNHTCVLCGKRGGNHHADHIKPFAYFPELRFELSSGRTLCVPRHRSTDTYGYNPKYARTA